MTPRIERCLERETGQKTDKHYGNNCFSQTLFLSEFIWGSLSPPPLRLCPLHHSRSNSNFVIVCFGSIQTDGGLSYKYYHNIVPYYLLYMHLHLHLPLDQLNHLTKPAKETVLRQRHISESPPWAW